MMSAFKVGLLGTVVSAALAMPAGPAHAQATYRCVDNGGQIYFGRGTPPAWCTEDRLVPKALLDRPVTEKEVEEVKGYLNQKLVDLARAKEACRAQHERIEDIKDDGLDALDEKADNRRSGRVSRRERRDAKTLEELAAKAHGAAKNCEQKTQQKIDEVNAVLSSQAKLRADIPALRVAKFQEEQALARERTAAEARDRALARAAEERRLSRERAAAQLSEELGQQLRAVLEDARGASEILATGPYNAFAARVWAIARQIQSIRVKYAAPLQNGDHKLLGAAVSQAWNALSAAEADWRKEQQAAADLASIKETVGWARARGGPTGSQLEALKVAQQQYEQAQMRQAASKESVTPLMAQAMKAARGDDEQALRARAPSQ